MLGLTLAEIMLFLLFALLLLIGAKSEEQEVEKSWVDLISQSLEDTEILAEVPSRQTREALGGLFEALSARKSPEETITETWSRIGTYLDNESFDDTAALNQEIVELQEEVDRQTERNKRLEESVANAANYTDALRKQLDVTRGGATPPCLYQTAENGEGLRGSSVPIGLVIIEEGELTFQSIYRERLEAPLVDFWGEQADTRDLLNYLDTLPNEVPLETSRFHSLAAPIKAIGDVDNDEHGRCLFTADYAMDDFVPLRMFTQVFQAYFLPQQRIRVDTNE